VPLSRNRSRPRCTVRGAARVHSTGAAHSHAAHGLDRHSLRGSRARRWRPNSAGPRNARRTAQARGFTARRRCSASRWRLGTGAREMAGKRRLTGAETAAWRDGDGRAARDDVGGFGPRRSGRRHERGERSGRQRHARGGREAGVARGG
jgi:hypothetical protein